ncbi:hypothetical protein Tco_0964744 [Tanacetum coccineum]
MSELTLALVAQQMAHRQKRGFDKQKHVINREVKRKNRGAKEPEQTKQVRRRTIIGMVRGKQIRKDPMNNWNNGRTMRYLFLPCRGAN